MWPLALHCVHEAFSPPLRLTPAAAGAQPALRRWRMHIRFMKKCVPSSSTPCSTPTASCRPTCFAVECTTCANADYPAKWVDCGAAATPPAATPAPSAINVQGTPPAVTPATIDAPAIPAAKTSAYLCGGKTKFVAQCGNCVSSEQCAIGFCCPYVATPSSATRPACTKMAAIGLLSRFMKKCVPSSSTPCSTPTATCRPTCSAVECTTCANADYPAKWVDCGAAAVPSATRTPAAPTPPKTVRAKRFRIDTALTQAVRRNRSCGPPPPPCPHDLPG